MPAITGRGSLEVLNVVEEKCCSSHSSSLGTFSSFGAKGIDDGLSGRMVGVSSAVTLALDEATTGIWWGNSSGTKPRSLHAVRERYNFLAVFMK